MGRPKAEFCVQGHRFDYIRPDGSNGCKTCKVANGKRSYQKNIEHERNRSRLWMANNKEVTRSSYLKRTYGITVEEYDKLVEVQQGRCAICDESDKALAVDHSHDTGEVRGLLCINCNTGIGSLKDDRSLLLKAVEYLQ